MSVRTLLRITHLAHRKSYLIIICPNSHAKLTKSEIRSSYYLLKFGFIYHSRPQNKFLFIFSLTYLYLTVFRLEYPYLGIFALNCHDFTICAIFTLYMYSYIETAPSVQNCRAIWPLFMDILHFIELGDTKVSSQTQFRC